MAPIDPTCGRGHWRASPEVVADQWLSASPWAATTKRSYRHFFMRWLGFCQDTGLDPWAVRVIHLERFLLTVPRSNQANACSAVSGFYRWAHASDYTTRDLSAGIRRTRQPRTTPGTWATPDELRRMLSISADDPADHRALATILILTGMRISEALHLDITDVTPPSGTAPMRLRVLRKGRHSDDLGVPPPVESAITPLLAKRSTGPLLRDRGHRLPYHRARELIADLGRRAECSQRITPHSLRRSFVTLARDLGIPDAEIMATTGHTTVNMLDRYDRGRREQLGVASIRVADALDG